MKVPGNGSLHHDIDIIKAFPKIRGNNIDMPMKMESGALIRCVTEFKMESGCDSI
jgi:hypothetical protein